MIAALFALAAAMIIGGCAAVIQGFPYVRLESGLAMVIAGSVAASSGAVLLGLGVARPRLPPGRAGDRAGARLAERGSERVRRRRRRHRPQARTGRGCRRSCPPRPAFIVPSVVEPPFDPERPRIEPSLQLRTDETRRASEPLAEPARSDPQPKPVRPSRICGVPAPPVVARDPAVPPQPDAADAAGRERRPRTTCSPRPRRFLGANDGAAAPCVRASTRRPSPSPRPRADTRTVVGRYASGGNTYVMFEDGSIEAETPQGRFTFASLDELKAFVDGGGESGTRGAA